MATSEKASTMQRKANRCRLGCSQKEWMAKRAPHLLTVRVIAQLGRANGLFIMFQFESGLCGNEEAKARTTDRTKTDLFVCNMATIQIRKMKIELVGVYMSINAGMY